MRRLASSMPAWVAGQGFGSFRRTAEIHTSVVDEPEFGKRCLNRVKSKPRSTEPDLHSQLETLFDQVWRSEADWRLWDRVDAAVMMETLRSRRAAMRPDEKAA
jgi:hypothetical protein